MAERDLRAALGRLILDEDEPAPMSGPIANPVDRFIHLPEPTRRWLESLREEDLDRVRELARFDSDDIAQLREAIEFHRSARIIGRFGKWAIITAVSTFVGAVAFGEKFGVALKWFTGAPK